MRSKGRDSDGIVGLLFHNGTKKLFFPAAGSSYSALRNNAGTYGYYWSQTLNTGSTNNAFHLQFFLVQVNPQGNSGRITGCSVRPVLD